MKSNGFWPAAFFAAALFALVLVCCTCHPINPLPPSPPAPLQDAAAPTMCERMAVVHQDELAACAARSMMPMGTLILVFEGACEPFTSDGPDAGVASGMYAACSAGGIQVTDADAPK